MAKKKPAKPLFEREFVDSMDPPNHAVPLLPDEDCRWPYLRIKRKTEDGRTHNLFFGLQQDAWQWEDHAPTWMDPELFLSMCRNHPKLPAVMQKCMQKCSAEPARKELPAILDEVFEEEYLVWVIERFEQVREYLIEWLVRNHAATHAKTQPKRRKKS